MGNQVTAVILVTHGRTGGDLLDTAERILGPLPRIGVLTVETTQGPAEMEPRLRLLCESLGGDEGVLFLVDLDGSTPSNLCNRYGQGKSAVVSGLNLPMLFKLATIDRTLSPRALAVEVARTGEKSIHVKEV